MEPAGSESAPEADTAAALGRENEVFHERELTLERLHQLAPRAGVVPVLELVKNVDQVQSAALEGLFGGEQSGVRHGHLGLGGSAVPQRGREETSVGANPRESIPKHLQIRIEAALPDQLERQLAGRVLEGIARAALGVLQGQRVGRIPVEELGLHGVARARGRR